MIDGSGIEEGRQQLEAIVLALEERGCGRVLEALEDRLQAQQVFAHARSRRARPGGRVTQLVVTLDLCAETEVEAPVREVLQVPGELSRRHRAARKGDRDIGSHAEPLRARGRRHDRQECVVARFGGRDAVEADRLQERGARCDVGQSDALLTTSGVLLGVGPEESCFYAQCHGVVLLPADMVYRTPRLSVTESFVSCAGERWILRRISARSAAALLRRA